MEGVGLAAAVVTLLEFFTHSIGLIDNIKSNNNDKKALHQAALGSRAIITLLKARTDEPSNGSSRRKAMQTLEGPGGPLEEMHNAIQEAVTVLTPSSSYKRKATRVIDWPNNAKAKLSERLQRETINWFSPLNFNQSHKEILARHCEGTGDWLFQSAEFNEWASGKSKTLWCTGIPGAGKSVLAALIQDHLQRKFKTDPQVRVVGIYLDIRKEETYTSENILAGIWSQLVQDQDSLRETAMALYRHHQERRTRPSEREIISIIKEELHMYDQTYIILDALDEASETRRSTLCSQLTDSTLPVSLLMTSRHITVAKLNTTVTSQLETRASDEDLRKYIRRQISTNETLHGFVATTARLENSILSGVVSKAGAMFFAAALHMETLSRQTSIKGVRNALKNLPIELDHIYDQALNRVASQPPEHRRLAEHIFTWVTYCYRPLSISTLQQALAIEPGHKELDDEAKPDKATMLRVCQGLVVTDYHSETLRLVHYTFENNLVRKERLPNAHAEIARTCMTYLAFDLFQASYQEEPYSLSLLVCSSRCLLLRYASHFWASHVLASHEIIRDEVYAFLNPGPRVYLKSPENFADGSGKIWLRRNQGFSTAAFYGLH
ncbi:MAG: hypothetical protein Q9222_007299 [Ikaeria aurantiellina]